ncbi:MAG: MFS transporter [Gammaproteobacteria bacterium]|nr:MFS transporter [Gammaproteobacteria bacterium]
MSAFQPWLIWGLACLFYFYECLLQVSPSVMSTELMRDFSVTSHTLGILSGVYFYSYAAMQLPCGVMTDYFGPRRLLTIATTICALSTIAFGLTNNFFTACVARLMIGFGSSFAAVGTLKLAASWFPAHRFAFLTGLMVTIGMLGAIFGETPLAILVDHYGWRHSMLIMGCLGMVVAILIFAFTKDHAEHSETEDTKEEGTLLQRFMILLRNKKLWMVACYGGLMYTATPVICGLWGVPFLMLNLGLSKATAANYISLILIGWAVSGPIWGIISNKIGRRKPPLFIGSTGALITLALLLLSPIQNKILIQLLLFFFGVFSSGFLPAFALAKELCDQKYVATAISFMNMMNMLGIALAQPAIGFILDKLWTGEIENQVRIYTVANYHTALVILPIGILIALIILPWIPETHCKTVKLRSK